MSSMYMLICTLFSLVFGSGRASFFSGISLPQTREYFAHHLATRTLRHDNSKVHDEDILGSDDDFDPNHSLNDDAFTEFENLLPLISQVCQPRHIHLSLGRTQKANNSSMTISFSFLPDCNKLLSQMSILRTNRPPNGNARSSEMSWNYQEKPIGAVRLGEDKGDVTILEFGNLNDVLSYNASLTPKQLKHAPNGETLYFSDSFYHIEVTGLKPGTRYYYDCVLLQEDIPSLIPGTANSKVNTNRNSDDERTLFRQHLRQTRSQSSNPKQNERHSNKTDEDIDYRPLVHTSETSTSSMNIISRSAQFSFLTPPAPGKWYPAPLDRSIKFAILGDLAARPHSRETISKLEHNRFNATTDSPHSNFNNESTAPNPHIHHGQGIDCILLAGDISYANGDESVWDDWMDMMSDHAFFQSIPVHIALGNHDLDYDYSTLEFGLAYEHRFRMPQRHPPIRNLAPNDLFQNIQAQNFVPYEYGNAYYSYIFGPSKHIVLSSYSSFYPGSTQHEWLLSELESTNRSVTPWLIIMLHCPLYTTFDSHNDEMFVAEARIHLEPVFLRYVVNFVIAGHVHSYMRTSPLANSTPHPRGPMYIIQGNGGRNANVPYLNSTAETWVQVRDHSMYGYGTLELCNVTHAKWKWVKTGFNAVGEGGAHRFEPELDLMDEVWVENQWFLEEP